MECQYGIDQQQCSKANSYLNRLKISPLGCDSCTLDPTVTQVLDKVRNPQAIVIARSWLRTMGFDLSLLEVKSILSTGFQCPVLKETIVVPCGLDHCRYHLDYPWAGNCLLAYLHQQGSESLSPEEISYLYGKPVEQVRKSLEDAIQILRNRSLESDSAADPSLSPKFRYLVTDHICCVCESEVDPDETPQSLRIDSIGAIYCSKECRDEKHPKLMELEINKGLPIDQILTWTFHRYKSLALAEQSLGIPRWLLYEACTKFLKKPIEHYFPAISPVQQYQSTALVRRTWHLPHWVNGLVNRIQDVRAIVYEQFGTPVVHPEAIRQNLNYVIQNL